MTVLNVLVVLIGLKFVILRLTTDLTKMTTVYESLYVDVFVFPSEVSILKISIHGLWKIFGKIRCGSSLMFLCFYSNKQILKDRDGIYKLC